MDTSPLIPALASLFGAGLLTAAIVPQVLRLGLRWGLTDKPDPRKQHLTPMVRLGGVGIVLGFSLALFITWLAGGFGVIPASRDALIWSSLFGSLAFFAIGLSDDLLQLPPMPRLALQIAVASAVWSQGVKIGTITLPFDSAISLTLPDWLSLIATVIWLVGITNAINWLDGLDGLAAGVSAIAALALLSVSFSLHQPGAGLLAAALSGSCLGFLRHNFNPARIFMGDGGSYFLGFSLAAISLIGPAKELTTVSLVLPLLILSLPLADMSAVIMGRVSDGHSPFYPDRRHLHHRLLRAGFSHRRTVLLIYAFTQWLAALALVAANAEMRFLWLALATAVLVWVVVRSRRSMQRQIRAQSRRQAVELSSGSQQQQPPASP